MSFYLPIVLQKYATNPLNKNLDLNNFQIKNLANGTAGTDAVNLNQLNAVVPTGSSGSLPFSLIRTATATTLGSFTNPSGDNIQYTNPSGGKLIFTDINGIDITGTPFAISGGATTFTNSSGSVVEVSPTGATRGIKINGNSDPNAPLLDIASSAGERHFTSSRSGVVQQSQVYIQDTTTGGLSMVELVKSNNGRGLDLTKAGSGNAIHITNTGSGQDIGVTDTGTGAGVVITKTNVANGNPALQVNSNTFGRTAEFFQQTATNPNSSVRMTNNSTAGGVNLDIETTGTGRGIRVLQSNATPAEAIAVTTNSGTSNVVYIENGGTGDCLRVADSVGGSTFFRINDAGHVGIQVPTGSLNNNHLLVNGGTNAQGTTQLAVSGSAQPDITLGSTADIYLGSSSGAGNRPRERVTFGNESGNTSNGRIYHQYYGGSVSGNQKWTWTQPASNDATMNIQPFLRRVGVGEIQSDYNAQGTLDIIAPINSTVPTLRIQRSTAGTLQRTLVATGSLGNIEFSNTGCIGVGVNNFNQSQGVPTISISDNGGLGEPRLNFTDPTGVTERCAILYDINTNPAFKTFQFRNVGTTANTYDFSFGGVGNSFFLFDLLNIPIGGFTFGLTAAWGLFNSPGNVSMYNFISDNSNPLGKNIAVSFANGATDALIASEQNVGIYSDSDYVEIYASNWINDPNEQRWQFKTRQNGNDLKLIGQTNTLTEIASLNPGGGSQQTILTASNILIRDHGSNPIRISNVATPSVGSDVANKAYVDAQVPTNTTGFTLAGPTSGNANNQRIFGLPQANVSGNALRADINNFTVNATTRSTIVDTNAGIINGLAPICKYSNTSGSIGVNSTLTNNYYYLFSSQASPNTGIQLNNPFGIAAFNNAPVRITSTVPAGFPTHTVWGFQLMKVGIYKFTISLLIGNFASGLASTVWFATSVVQGTTGSTPNTLAVGVKPFFIGYNQAVSNFANVRQVSCDINFSVRCSALGFDDYITLGMENIYGGSMNWGGFTIGLTNLMCDVEYLGFNN